MSGGEDTGGFPRWEVAGIYDMAKYPYGIHDPHIIFQ